MTAEPGVVDGRPRGWFWVQNAIYDQPISREAIAVYINLCRRANGQRLCHPMLETIATDTKMGRATATRAMKDLRAAGLVTVVTSGKGHGRGSVYRVEPVPETAQGEPLSAGETAQGEPLNGSQRAFKRLRVSHIRNTQEGIPKKEGAAPNPENQRVIARYCELWKDKYGSAPMIRGKEAGQIAGIVKHYGGDKALEIIAAYFDTPDKFAKERGHSVPILVTMLPQLVAGMAPEVEHRDTWGGKW